MRTTLLVCRLMCEDVTFARMFRCLFVSLEHVVVEAWTSYCSISTSTVPEHIMCMDCIFRTQTDTPPAPWCFSSIIGARVRRVFGLAFSWSHVKVFLFATWKRKLARDKQTFVTFHVDMRICCFLCIVAIVRYAMRVQRQCVKRTLLPPSVLVKLRCSLCRIVQFFCSVQCSRSLSEGTTSFRQHGFEAAILLRQHVQPCFISIASHVFN